MKRKVLIAAICVALAVLLGMVVIISGLQNNNSQNIEDTQASGNTQETQKTTEGSTSSEPSTDPTEDTYITEPTEGVDLTEPTEGVDLTEPTEGVDLTEPTEGIVLTEPIETYVPTDPTESTESIVDTVPPTDPIKETQPTEVENNFHMEGGLYVAEIKNVSGMYVEDGSDIQVDSVAAVVVENVTERTIQLAEFKLVNGSEEYVFRLTTLPPGARATIQELNKKSFSNTKVQHTCEITAFAFFPEEPSLHSDVFSISGFESGIEVRNITDKDIAGPIYVYYKTRSSDGYAGGITYRVTIPELKAGKSFSVTANHFWIGSSEVMFIDYA